MIYTKEQLILRVSCAIDEINRELDRCPDITDIPDEEWTDEECDVILENNLQNKFLYAFILYQLENERLGRRSRH